MSTSSQRPARQVSRPLRPLRAHHAHPAHRRQPPRWLALLLIAGALAGCAGQTAYTNGRDLVANNQIEEGLAEFRRAIAENPGNLEYQKTYAQTRERAIYNFVEQARRAGASGDLDGARMLYQRALNIEPTNERAREGLLRLERNHRHGILRAEARAALAANDLAGARDRLAVLMREDPTAEANVALQQEVNDLAARSDADKVLSQAYRKPITIEFRDATLQQIFDIISRSSGLNFVFDKEVRLDQRSSIFLRNSTIESAIQFTLLTNQLEHQILDANTILIYPNTAAKAKDYQEMIVKSIYLGNAEAKTVANTLRTILKVRDLVVDDKLNMIIIRDTPDIIKLAEKLVAWHDVPEPEVMLEVAVLEVSRTRLQDLGVQWPSSLALTPLASSSGGTVTLNDLRNLNGNTIGANVGSLTINARQDDTDSNLLANPRIRARNHEKAKILIGQRLPNITSTATATGFVTESVNYVDVGLKLDVEPTIYLDNDVAIKIALEVSSVNNQVKTTNGTIAYEIGTRNASTVLRLKDGENQILAGLINDEDRNTASKVPYLGNIPILGRLFGTNSNNKVKTEIVLSITPHLIRNIRRPDAASAQFKSGTDASISGRAERLAAPTEAAAALAPPPASSDTMGRVPLGPGGVPLVAAPMAATAPAVAAVATPSAMVAASSSGNGNGNGSALQAQWQAPSSVKAGDTFMVQLQMQSGAPVSSMPMVIGFDSQVLQVLSVVEGSFLKQGGANTAFSSQVNPDGTITVANSRPAGSGGASAPAPALIVSLRALTTTDAARIRLLSLNPVDAANQPIGTEQPTDLSIRIAP